MFSGKQEGKRQRGDKFSRQLLVDQNHWQSPVSHAVSHAVSQSVSQTARSKLSGGEYR